MRRLFCIFVMGCLLFTLSGQASGESPIRLHVIADSNDKAAQELKMIVRDAVYACVAELIAPAKSEREAYAIISLNLCDIARAAKTAAREAGYEGEIRVETGIMPFPAKLYGNVLVEAGEYHALKVSVGSARGANWWCVLYPGLCRYPTRETGGEIQVYSEIARFFARLFGKDV